MQIVQSSFVPSNTHAHSEKYCAHIHHYGFEYTSIPSIHNARMYVCEPNTISYSSFNHTAIFILKIFEPFLFWLYFPYNIIPIHVYQEKTILLCLLCCVKLQAHKTVNCLFYIKYLIFTFGSFLDLLECILPYGCLYNTYYTYTLSLEKFFMSLIPYCPTLPTIHFSIFVCFIYMGCSYSIYVSIYMYVFVVVHTIGKRWALHIAFY